MQAAAGSTRVVCRKLRTRDLRHLVSERSDSYLVEQPDSLIIAQDLLGLALHGCGPLAACGRSQTSHLHHPIVFSRLRSSGRERQIGAGFCPGWGWQTCCSRRNWWPSNCWSTASSGRETGGVRRFSRRFRATARSARRSIAWALRPTWRRTSSPWMGLSPTSLELRSDARAGAGRYLGGSPALSCRRAEGGSVRRSVDKPSVGYAGAKADQGCGGHSSLEDGHQIAAYARVRTGAKAAAIEFMY